MKQAALSLDNSLLIGEGGVRKVFQHPDFLDRCIKVTHNMRRRRSVRRELIYLILYKLKKKPFNHLPKYYGMCTTSQGRGAVFQLFRDYDGSISSTLTDHLSGKVKDPLSPHKIVELLQELISHFLKHNIIICDPAPQNLVVYTPINKQPRLVIIDGIGNPHFIKIADLSSHYAHKLIKKKWGTYIERNPILQEVFAVTNYQPIGS